HGNCRGKRLGDSARRPPDFRKRFRGCRVQKVCTARSSFAAAPAARSAPTPAENIDELLAIEYPPPAMAIVPSRDGTGTNALLRTPPTLFPSHFGAGSFAKHLAEAKQASAQIVLRRNFRLEMDVDDESDLHALLEYDLSATATGRWLCEAGLDVKFRSGRKRETKVAAGNHL